MIDSLIKKIKDKFSKSEYDEEEYDGDYEEDEYEEDEYEEEGEENKNLEVESKKNSKNNRKNDDKSEAEVEEDEEDEYEEDDYEEEDEDESKAELSEEEKNRKDKKSKIIQIFAFVAIVYVVLTWEEEPKKEKKIGPKKNEKLVKKKKKNKKIVKAVKSPNVKKAIAKKDDPMAILEEDSPELDGSDFGLGDDFLTNEKPKSIINKPKKVSQESIENEKIPILEKDENPIAPPENRNPASMVMSNPSILKESLIKKIKKKKELYTNPPNYSFRGRGLVYNCKGKHWACVDKESYLKCRENEKWQIRKNKKIECKTINVYQNIRDCNIIQLNNIHTLVKADFCKN